MKITTVIRRALATNLRTVVVGEDERAALDAAGLREPIVQQYVTWRRAMMLAVVAATLLSAAVTTLRKNRGPHDRKEVLQTITAGLLQKAEKTLPAAAILEEATHPPGRTDLPKGGGQNPPAGFARFENLMHAAHLDAIALAALAALFCRNRFQLSYRILVAGFALGFLLPMALAMCPWSWWGMVEVKITPGTDPAAYLQVAVQRAIQAANYLVILLPTLLSLVPGALRAGLRVKTQLPESLLPGWFVAAASPFYSLCLLVPFVVAVQFTHDLLLLGGLFLLLAAPLVYAFRAGVFTNPRMSEADTDRMGRLQLTVGLMSLLASGLIVAWLLTRDIAGVHLVGVAAGKSLFHPMDLVDYLLEYLARSLFVTVLGADLFMRISLRAWEQSREWAASDHTGTYDRTMEAIRGVSR